MKRLSGGDGSDVRVRHDRIGVVVRQIRALHAVTSAATRCAPVQGFSPSSLLPRKCLGCEVALAEEQTAQGICLRILFLTRRYLSSAAPRVDQCLGNASECTQVSQRDGHDEWLSDVLKFPLVGRVR